MTDIRYIYSEWQDQLDALNELTSGWGDIRGSLKAADDAFGDMDEKMQMSI